MTISEFIDLFELEPVIARLRLNELSFTMDDYKRLTVDEWNKFIVFQSKLTPTWTALLFEQSKSATISAPIGNWSEDDWQIVKSISPAMYDIYRPTIIRHVRV